ncbi:MAG: amino acid ABC transporter permease, partial [Chloroflexota bacterium]
NGLNDMGNWLVANGITQGAVLADLRTRDIPNTARAIFGLAISYSAFLSEVFRAGIDSIGQGQREAALSLGMTRWQVMRYIVLPQAFRVVLPPLGNDFIAMLKESSLVSIVGVEDITRQGSTTAQSNFVFFQAYNVVALTYLVLTLTLSMLVKGLEGYLDRGKARDT